MNQKRVLIVDDSTTIRKVVTGILERHGYEAVAAADAQIALEALRGGGQKFDLVLVDFVMPRMNGFQFCRELRKVPLGHTVPVVLMSAKSDKIREKFVLQTGAVDATTSLRKRVISISKSCRSPKMRPFSTQRCGQVSTCRSPARAACVQPAGPSSSRARRRWK